MDRYFQSTDKTLSGGDLHLVGVCAMYIASKYEDVIPLMMRTIINKIGHNKFEIPVIEDKELDILKAIQYKIGSPTVKEFLDRFIEEVDENELRTDKFLKITMYLAKMSCHNYNLMQLPTSLLASAVFNVALKIYEKIDPNVDVASIMSRVISFAKLDLIDAKLAVKEMLAFSKGFDKQYPNFKNLK
jgi:hypothetical protein